jgi:hypothetical protein
MRHEPIVESSPGDATPDRDDLGSKSVQLAADILTISRALSEVLQFAAREGSAATRDAADQLAREAYEQTEAAVATAGKYGHALEDRITRSPIVSILLALGLGFVAGLIARR